MSYGRMRFNLSDSTGDIEEKAYLFYPFYLSLSTFCSYIFRFYNILSSFSKIQNYLNKMNKPFEEIIDQEFNDLFDQ